MSRPTLTVVVCHHLDIFHLTLDGKHLGFMTHKDIWIAEYIKVNLQQVAESLKMYTTGHQITTLHHQMIGFMTEDHTQERLPSLGMVLHLQVTCIQIFHMDSHRLQDRRHLMNQGQSCRGHFWSTETIQHLMNRMVTMSVTIMIEHLEVTEGTQTTGQLRLNHIQWKEELSMEEMRLRLTRCVRSMLTCIV